VEKEDILKQLEKKGKISKEEAGQLFDKLLHKGILSNAETDLFYCYDIPIPSMKEYLFAIAGDRRYTSREGK